MALHDFKIVSSEIRFVNKFIDMGRPKRKIWLRSINPAFYNLIDVSSYKTFFDSFDEQKFLELIELDSVYCACANELQYSFPKIEKLSLSNEFN